MLNKRIAVSTLLFFCTTFLFVNSQSVINIKFYPCFRDSVIKIGESYEFSNNKDRIEFDNLKWYISGIELLKTNKPIWQESNSFHLMNIADEKSLHLKLMVPKKTDFDQIKFNLGIDSITNSSGALGGDLDPRHEMYWTWQSGYINFKLEGTLYRSEAGPVTFQFHLGGYQYPFNSMSKILLETSASNEIEIKIELDKWLNEVDLSTINRIMSPGEKAVFLSEKIARVFVVQNK